MFACSGSLPRPPPAPIAPSDYVPVPFAPREPPLEFVPPSPVKDAVWVDGSWEWTGDRYVWRFGSWVVPPPGARRAHWVLVRRAEDGQLFFAPSSWKDERGDRIDDRAWAYRLGPRARARARLGAPPGAAPPSIESEGRPTPSPNGDQADPKEPVEPE
jgi:hypothetical protein